MPRDPLPIDCDRSDLFCCPVCGSWCGTVYRSVGTCTIVGCEECLIEESVEDYLGDCEGGYRCEMDLR